MFNSKPNILIVGNYTRYDYLEQFKASKNDFNFFFLEFISPKEEANTYYTTYGRAIYWSDYKNAFDLLQKIRPAKVLFIFIEAYNHVALNAACQVTGIHTFIIDHGILDININYRLSNYFSKQSSSKSLKSNFMFLFLFINRLRSRLFLKNTIKLLPDSLRQNVLQFVQIRSKQHFEDAIKIQHFTSRLPNFYLSFSKKNFSFYHLQDESCSENNVHFIGIPLYDELAKIKPSTIKLKNILLIDQPLATKKLLGWDMKQHLEFVNNLAKICKEHQYKLHIKLHPLQSEREKGHWSSHPEIFIMDSQLIKRLLTESHIIIGFFSTLLLPLTCLGHTTTITLENHPVGKLDVSKSFIDAGVAHPIYDLDELPWALENIDHLHQKQKPNKKQFEKDWLYKFDGKSGERLRDILLSDEL